LTILSLLICATIQDANVYVFQRTDRVTTQLQNDAKAVLSNFNWLASVNKYGFSIMDPGAWNGWLNFTTFALVSNSTNVLATTGTTSQWSQSIVGTNTISFVVSFAYTCKNGIATTVTGTGSITYTSKAFNLTRIDVLPATETAVFSVDLTASTVVVDASYPTDAYSQNLLIWMQTNMTNSYNAITADLNTAFAAYYVGKTPLPSKMTLETQLPDKTFNFDLGWTVAPVYSSTGVVYALNGLSTPQIVKVQQKKQFLKMLAEEEVNAAPVFDPTAGASQLFLAQPVLDYFATYLSTLNQVKITINNLNNPSRLFKVSMDYLGQICPGVLYSFPTDYQFTINVVFSTIAVTSYFSPASGTLVASFSVVDTKSNVLLTWNSLLSFGLNWLQTGTTLNFQITSLSQIKSTIVQTPYGYVNMSTLEQWLDDSLSNYQATNWQLFKASLDLSTIFSTVSTVSWNGSGLLIAGN